MAPARRRSGVADWMSSVDLFLEDEGQQYGNMEEAVAGTPAPCLEVWSGDHRQTPGGLKKSKESKSFRKKLTKRPLALRCQTRYIQAHDLGGIAMRFLDCPKDSFPWKIRQLLEHGSTAIDPAVAQFWHELIGDSPPCFSREIQRAAFAILGMVFFFLHCRASTRHGRSTTGIRSRKESKVPLEARKQQTKTKHKPKTQTHQPTSTRQQHHRQGNSQN